MKTKMKKYIITYHFRNNSRNYSSFYEAIKTNFPENKHIIESAWIVNSDKTAKEISKLLTPHLHFENYDCDTLFVAEIDKTNVEGMIAKSAWPFITDKEEKKDEEKMG